MSLNNQNDGSTFYPAGAVIYNQGDQSQSLYIVKRGEVRLMRFINNHLHVFQICKPGEVLNDISVLTRKPLDHVAITKIETEIVAIPAKDIKNVIDKCPKWIPDIFATLCERLLDSQEIIHEHNLSSGALDKNFILSKEEERKYLDSLEDFKN